MDGSVCPHMVADGADPVNPVRQWRSRFIHLQMSQFHTLYLVQTCTEISDVDAETRLRFARSRGLLDGRLFR